MALLEEKVLEEKAATMMKEAGNGDQPPTAGKPISPEPCDAAKFLGVQQDANSASPSMGVAVTNAYGKHVNVVREQVCVPLLAECRASLPLSPSPEPRRKAVSSSPCVECQPELPNLGEALDGEQEYSPLERYLLRTGEILESYNVTSRALTR